MDQEQNNYALQAANLALSGRRRPLAAPRFASIQLRDLDDAPRFNRSQWAWEVAAVLCVASGALLAVAGLWFF